MHTQNQVKLVISDIFVLGNPIRIKHIVNSGNHPIFGSMLGKSQAQSWQASSTFQFEKNLLSRESGNREIASASSPLPIHFCSKMRSNCTS